MAQAAGVETDGQSELWLKTPLKKVRQDNVQCHAHESVIVFLRRVGGTQYVVLKPSIKVLDQNGAEVPYEVAGPGKPVRGVARSRGPMRCGLGSFCPRRTA
jgi:hypothetical protein